LHVLSAILIAVLCAALAQPVFAQTPAGETRAAVIARQQQEKGQMAAPYQPSRVEALFARFEQRGFPFVGTPPGFYPALGSVYPGGGFAGGLGYRKYTGYSARVDLDALYSVETYKRAEATFRSPGHARGRLEYTSRAGWMDAPRVDYYGLGSNTAPEDNTVFRLRETYADGGLSWHAKRWLQLGASGGYEGYDEGSGTGGKTSIEERFTPATAPRLGEDPSFARATTTASLLWLNSPGYARRGGFVRWTYDGRARLDEDGSFGVTRTELVQHIPIRRETWVLSLRGRADAVVGDPSDAPFFLLPSLGSGNTLRAYSTGRFRDRKSLLLSGEWRWIPSRLALDLAVFVDAGNVGATWDAVTSGGWKRDYGIGARIHTPAATALRIDLARGDEGMRLVFATSAPF
jgi:outer membrane protein assembly factor BamA